MTLYLYDMSAIVYSGALSHTSKNWNTSFFPTGGLYKAFSFIFRDLKKLKEGDNLIVCFEGKGSVRKQAFPDYKSNRKMAKSDLDREIVSVQLEALQELLPKIGIPTYSIEGYEADDVIYSLVAKHSEDKIIIRADDSDYYDTVLLNRRVKMESVTGKEIVVRRHTTIAKIIDGDRKDNVPPLSNPHYKQAVLTAYHKKVLSIYRQGTVDQIVDYLRQLKMPEVMVPEVARNIFLKQPKFIEFEEIPQVNIDKKELSVVLNVLGFKSFLKRELGEERDYYSPQVKDGLINLLSKTSIDLKNHFLEVRQKETPTYLSRNPEVDLGDREIKHRDRGADLDKALEKTNRALGLM